MHLSQEMKDCIERCTECANTCTATISHCLEQGGKHAEASHVRLLMDCASICRTSAGFMLRGSPIHGAICAACAEVCRLCAEDCRKVGGDEMVRCADECDRCVQSCERMAGGGRRARASSDQSAQPSA